MVNIQSLSAFYAPSSNGSLKYSPNSPQAFAAMAVKATSSPVQAPFQTIIQKSSPHIVLSDYATLKSISQGGSLAQVKNLSAPPNHEKATLAERQDYSKKLGKKLMEITPNSPIGTLLSGVVYTIQKVDKVTTPDSSVSSGGGFFNDFFTDDPNKGFFDQTVNAVTGISKNLLYAVAIGAGIYLLAKK